MNVISYDNHGIDCLCSNGCFNVLMTVIGLSGSAIARNDYEKDLIIWLMERDQTGLGIGNAVFDITEMPWNIECFNEQKRFMELVLAGVLKKSGWETLYYSPDIKIIRDKVSELNKMFSLLREDDISETFINEWKEDLKELESHKMKYPRCRKHGIYLSEFGCIACNDVVVTE